MRLGGRAVRRPCGRIHLWGRGAERRAERLHAEPCVARAAACTCAGLGNPRQSSAIKRNQAQSSACTCTGLGSRSVTWRASLTCGKRVGRRGEHLHAATCRASLTHLLRRREVDRRVQ
jgi:hypothetical protein